MRILNGYDALKLIKEIDVHNPDKKTACPLCGYMSLELNHVSAGDSGRKSVIITCPGCEAGTHFDYI